MDKVHKRKQRSFFRDHSLSIVSIFLLIVWIISYSQADPNTHLGSFFGNAIADWSGSVIIILGTKFFLEIGSSESRKVRGHKKNPIINFLWEHSLLLFLFVTGVGWLGLYFKMNPTGKWGQVVGNIVSEWLQMGGLVFLTKKLIERGSKESN